MTLVPWVVFSFCLTVTILTWFVVGQLSHERDKARFSAIGDQLQDEIETRLEHETSLGQATAAFMGANPNASSDDFDNYLARWGWPNSSPRVGTIAFIVHVPPNGLEAFRARAKLGGVLDLKLDPKLDFEECDLVLYRSPETSGMKPRGFNLDTDLSRRTAIQEAMETGLPSTTGITTLRQDLAHPVPAVIIFNPVYTTPGPPSTVEERRREIVGFVSVGVRIAQSLKSAFAVPVQSPEATFVIHAGSPHSNDNIVYDNRNTKYKSHFVHTTNYASFGSNWTTVFYSSPTYDEGGDNDSSWTILVGGLVFSFALFLLTGSQAKSHRDVEEYAMEIERRAACESLLSSAGGVDSEEDFDTVLSKIGRAAVPSYCDWCGVYGVRDGQVRCLAIYHENRATVEFADRIFKAHPPKLTNDYGVGLALRTGVSQLFEEMSEGTMSEGGRTEEQVEFFTSHGMRSMMILPVLILGEPYGSLTFMVGEEKRPFTKNDLRQAEEVAQRIGLTVENRSLFRAVQEELTERQKAEEALRVLNEDLEEAVDKRTRELTVAVDELEAFCYSVSHDLRAPLRSVDGFSKALLEDYQETIDEDGVDYLTRIRSAAKRMDELITAMLNLSRLSRAEISPVNIDVTEIAREIAEEIRRESKVQIEIQPNMTAFGDPHMIRITLENLIANGVKFSTKVENAKVQVGEEEGVFFVKDNGAGFDPAYSNKLFQPFERLHTATEFPGTGIGLATVDRIVKRHGGQIWAESTPGHGATFFFTLAPSGTSLNED